MKIRNGFVSNSSSSSFVVSVKEDGLDYWVAPGKAKPLLTPRQIKALKRMGFQYCEHTYASRVEQTDVLEVYPEARDSKTATMMYLSVVCNQSDIVEKLVLHEIPFIASCQYGHETVVWRKDDEYVYVLPNLGVEYETYHDMPELLKAKPLKIRKVSVKSINEKGFW
jgi:hypothetical protein